MRTLHVVFAFLSVGLLASGAAPAGSLLLNLVTELSGPSIDGS